MDLRDYPRPKGDTGIGVHWNAGFPAAIGLGEIRDRWLPELIALGVKWVKLSRHDGGQELAELLLKNDIMPIVRVYRPQPNPGILDEAALRAVRNYVAAGVRYFEFNNEPDLAVEWQNHLVPPDAVEIVARNAIRDMDAILSQGGYPGIPALAVGTKWDLVGEICRLGRRDLLAAGVWQALHNYSLNHPLDYPADPGNQEGAPIAREFYDRLALERWDGDAWDGWSLERVNQERRDHANPGHTAFEDPSCWRSYERYDRLIREQIGRSLPILATENGYIVGERPDPRYAATTPLLHMAQTLEACRAMMGTSTRFDHAPDYLFCTAFWLLGNYSLGHWAPEWEGQAWYSSRWPDGYLPIVPALKAEPKQARPWRGDGGVAGRIVGTLKNGAGLTVQIARPDGWQLTGRAGDDGRYELDDLPLAAYNVAVIETTFTRTVTLTRERPAATADFDLSGITVVTNASIIRGEVRGGAGLTIRLARPADGWNTSQVIAADGAYRFERLAAGTYVVALAEAEVARADIVLDGRNEVVVDLAAPGWGWEVTDGGPGPGFGIIRCRVKGKPDLLVRLWTVGWAGMTQRTGSKAEFGNDACEFAPLGAGVYTVQPEGIEVKAEVRLDGGRALWVTFAETAAHVSRNSVIAGRVTGGAGRRLILIGPDGDRSETVRADGAYRFEGLSIGIYRLEVEGTTISQDGIILDGHNRVSVDLEVPVPRESIIFGTVKSGAGRRVRLLLPPATGAHAETLAAEDGSYKFEKLPPGLYTVAVLEAAPSEDVVAQKTDLNVDGVNLVQADFTLPGVGPAWRWQIEDASAGPGFSILRCQIVGLAQTRITVRLWTPGWNGVVQQTGSKPEYGPNVCEFAPLGAGSYSIALEDVEAGPAAPPAEAVETEVSVGANRVVWARFIGGDPQQPPKPVEPEPPQPPQPPPAPKRSVISGSVKNGDGLFVLLTGPGTEKHTEVANGRYRFAGLEAGVYRVAILAADPALGEVAARANLTVDGANAVTADFDLAEPPPAAAGRIAGRVKGGAGRRITLAGPDGLTLTATVAADETYAFDDLPAGLYQATVSDSDPPTGTRTTQGGIKVEAAGTARVDFDLDALKPGKTMEHYLLVGGPVRSKDDFLAVLQYVARFDPVVGSDEAEARSARHVTILGGVSMVSALVEQGLRMSGCQVRRIESDYAAALRKLIDAGRPW